MAIDAPIPVNSFVEGRVHALPGNVLEGGQIALPEFFAAAALMGLVASDVNAVLKPNDCADWAYKVADAMIAEKAKREGGK